MQTVSCPTRLIHKVIIKCAYVENRPINFSDPMGCCKGPEADGPGGAIQYNNSGGAESIVLGLEGGLELDLIRIYV